MPKQLFRRDFNDRDREAQEHHTSPFVTHEPEHLLTPQSLALSDLPIDAIVPNPFQARTSFDAASLQELAHSITEHGFITRIRVRPSPHSDDIFELVYGERRWRAARMAGLSHIPCEIVPYTDDELTEIGFIENVQRDDLVPTEEAEMYRQLLEQQDENEKPKYSIRSLAKRIGKDKGYVEARLALLRAPEDVQQLLKAQPDVPLRVARELIKVPSPEERAPIVEQVRTGTLRTEDVRAIVKQHIQPGVETHPSDRTARPIQPVEEMGLSPVQEQSLVENNVLPSTLQSVEKEHVTPLSPAARLVFERTLQRDHEAVQRVFERVSQGIQGMGEAEKMMVREHVLVWEDLLEQVKQHLLEG